MEKKRECKTKIMTIVFAVAVCVLAAFSFAACNNDKTDDAAELEQLKQETIQAWDNAINNNSAGLDGHIKHYADDYIERLKGQIENAKTVEEVNALALDARQYYNVTLKRYYKWKEHFLIDIWSDSFSTTITGKYDGEEYSFTISYGPSHLSSFNGFIIKSENEQYVMDLRIYGKGASLSQSGAGDVTQLDAVKETKIGILNHDERENLYLSVISKKGEEIVGYTVFDMDKGYIHVVDTQSFVKSDDKKATKEDATRLVEDAIAGKKSDVNVTLRANKATHKFTEYTSNGLNALNLTVFSAGKDGRSEIKLDMVDKTSPNRSVKLRVRSNVDFEAGTNITKSIDLSNLDTSIYASNDDTNGYIKVMVEEHGYISSVIIVAVNHDENGFARFDLVNALRFVIRDRYYEDEKDFPLPDEFMASSFADYAIAQYEQAMAPSAQN
ncbi:MAG: hypothetical protein ACI4SC_00680 [Candidatus Neoclostridium sp.]